MQAVFSISNRFHNITFRRGTTVPQHLVYIEWYTPFSDEPDYNHLLYKISPLHNQTGGPICSVILLANICCSIHLFPRFCYFYLLNLLCRGVALALMVVAARRATLPPSLIRSYSLVRLIFAAVGWTFSLSLNPLTAGV